MLARSFIRPAVGRFFSARTVAENAATKAAAGNPAGEVPLTDVVSIVDSVAKAVAGAVAQALGSAPAAPPTTHTNESPAEQLTGGRNRRNFEVRPSATQTFFKEVEESAHTMSPTDIAQKFADLYKLTEEGSARWFARETKTKNMISRAIHHAPQIPIPDLTIVLTVVGLYPGAFFESGRNQLVAVCEDRLGELDQSAASLAYLRALGQLDRKSTRVGNALAKFLAGNDSIDGSMAVVLMDIFQNFQFLTDDLVTLPQDLKPKLFDLVASYQESLKPSDLKPILRFGHKFGYREHESLMVNCANLVLKYSRVLSRRDLMGCWYTVPSIAGFDGAPELEAVIAKSAITKSLYPHSILEGMCFLQNPDKALLNEVFTICKDVKRMTDLSAFYACFFEAKDHLSLVERFLKNPGNRVRDTHFSVFKAAEMDFGLDVTAARSNAMATLRTSNIWDPTHNITIPGFKPAHLVPNFPMTLCNEEDKIAVWMSGTGKDLMRCKIYEKMGYRVARIPASYGVPVYTQEGVEAALEALESKQ